MQNPLIKSVVTTAMCLVQAAVCLPGCQTQPAGGGGGGDMDMPAMRTLSVEFDGLEPLGDGFVYEGWLIVDDNPVSTGRFDILADGSADPADFDVSAEDADAATIFVLTIEPAVGDDPAPADTHVLAGPIDSGMADLTVGHAAAVGDDFAMAEGTFILNTPSTGDNDDDYAQGIWWLVPGDEFAPSLDLPTLPAGWAYEGWVVGEDGPVSTGKFDSPDGADSDGAGPTSGPDDAPPFPGQDFIDPPVNLVGFAAVISVEPDPDDSEAPFAFKPLVDMDIEDVGIGVGQDMENNAAALPTGTVTIGSEG